MIYKGLQRTTKDYKDMINKGLQRYDLQRITKDYKGLQRTTKDYKDMIYKGLQRITKI